MKLRYIVLIISILLVTYFGYTLQPNSIPFIDNFIEEKVEEQPDYSEEISDFLHEYENFFSQKFNECGSVGAAVAIVYKGQVVFLKPYGVKRIYSTDSVDIHTIFRLASVSKGFAGVLASKLHFENSINLDTSIVSYLPDFHLKNAFNQNNVTLRNALSHTTGLISYSFDPSIEDGVSYNSVYHDLYRANIDSKPGEKYAYQNVMFSLIDTIAQIKTGKSYENLMKEQIFTPLGMSDATMTFDGFTSTNNYAYPHKGWGKNVYSLKLNDRYYETKPAAGVNASIVDMSKWLQAIMGYSTDVISSEVINDVTTPRIVTPVKYVSSRTWGDLQNKEYGMGWRILTVNGKKVVYHGGFVEGYRAEIAFCPEKEIGIVMLQNSANTLAVEAVPNFINAFFKYSENIPQIISILDTTKKLSIASSK